MRVGIIGAGAIGGFFAARLAHAGVQVSVVARGRTLEAIRSNGIWFESNAERFNTPVRASHIAADLGPQDAVIIAVKAPALAEAAKSVAPLLGPETVIVPAMNGLPWWYFLGDGVPLAGMRLNAVDPDGTIESVIALERVIGTVVFPSCSSPQPGFVQHASGTRVVLGEALGGYSPRVEALVACLKTAGIAAEQSADVRREIWLKLLGNVCFNPVSLLTGSPTEKMIADPGLHALFTGMMREMLALGERLGIAVDIDPAARIEVARKLGNVKTSMLQDFEAHRPVEIGGIIGSVVECAAVAQHTVPLLQCVHALCTIRARNGTVPVAAIQATMAAD